MRYLLQGSSISLFLLTLTAAAQSGDLENFHAEVTASAMRTEVEGTLQSGVLPVALHGDLNLADRWQFFGKLVFKPGRRHRINVEGSPYTFSGRNTLARTITFNGRTYSFQEPIASNADLAYFFAGYQFDIVAVRQGHLGLEAGGAYVHATGTIRGVTSGLTGTREQRIGIPLAGAEFRVFIVPGSHLLNVNGEAKGMSLGGYGSYFQGNFNVGAGVRWVTVQAGYQYLNADVHENRSVNPVGVNPVIRGPVFSIQLRDR